MGTSYYYSNLKLNKKKKFSQTVKNSKPAPLRTTSNRLSSRPKLSRKLYYRHFLSSLLFQNVFRSRFRRLYYNAQRIYPVAQVREHRYPLDSRRSSGIGSWRCSSSGSSIKRRRRRGLLLPPARRGWVRVAVHPVHITRCPNNTRRLRFWPLAKIGYFFLRLSAWRRVLLLYICGFDERGRAIGFFILIIFLCRVFHAEIFRSSIVQQALCFWLILYFWFLDRHFLMIHFHCLEKHFNLIKLE